MSDATELLTVEQFAERLQVSRTTIFSWIKQGGLRESVHYFRRGRVLRFRWQTDTFFPNCQRGYNGAEDASDMQLLPESGAIDSQRGAAPVHNRQSCASKLRKAPAMNLDY